jgi:type IV pilus biogenesis protein CpaD/CtpE
MKKFILTLPFLLMACTQTTPSMMNVAPVELSRETVVEQIAIDDVNDALLTHIANHHRKSSNGPLELTMTYDPKSRDFTAMNAVNELKSISKALQYKGVYNMVTQTLAVPEGTASLMVSYDTVMAHAPSNCDPMPGLDNNLTGRDLGNYKFGCGVESMIARQIARPADLEGNSTLSKRDARREAAVVEDYSAGVPREPLEGIEREDLTSGE